MGQMLERFKQVFSGLEIAYGQTKKTDNFSETGKHQTKSFTIKNPPTDKLWQAHLDGEDPALGIVPIREDNKCKWGCIDIDTYPFDHKSFIKKIRDKNIPMILFRSKSGGAHAFLFTKDFVPASLMRDRLKKIAAELGHARAEIFPKQDYIRADRGDTGSFLNLPYHGSDNTVRYAFDDEGNKLSLTQFLFAYSRYSLSEKQLAEIRKEKQQDKDESDPLKGAPPCLIAISKEGIPNGQRNNAMYNFGVYLKKRFSSDWDLKMHDYNKKYCTPPLERNEIQILIKSVNKKEYQYKCKDEPIQSFCNSKLCVLQEFGVGDGAPSPEITEIRKYDSDPPIYFVTIDGESVEVDDMTLHDSEKFSISSMNQLNRPMLPVGKIIWRKMLVHLFKNLGHVPAPESSKINVQVRELLADFINKAPGKDINDIKRGLPYSDEKDSYFKFKDFWRYLQRTKSWPDKTYPKQKTMRLLEELFSAIELTKSIDGKNTRIIKMDIVKLERPNVRKTKMKDEPFV
jgi:phosphoglycolate phosphatase-like HAD superfamily hydrolase